MRSSARVEVMGYLGTDAAVTFLQSGTPVCKFSVAHSPRTREGEPERTNWYRCVIFGQRGEKVSQYLVKGTPVFVRGDLDVREYEANDGTTRTSLDVNVSELELLGSKGDQPQEAPPQRASRPAFGTAAKAAATTANTDWDDDPDIPF